jgi:hypothetical protein
METRKKAAVGLVGAALLGVGLFSYAAVAGLTQEYGPGVLGWGDTLIPAALVFAAVVAVLALVLFAVTGVRKRLAWWTVPATVAVTVVASGLGGHVGAEANQRTRLANALSCLDGAGRTTVGFAREVGRIIPGNDRLANSSPTGCLVEVAVPGSVRDPTGYVDEAVAPAGWERIGPARWARGDGFVVTARRFDEGGGTELYLHLRGRGVNVPLLTPEGP